MRIGIDFGSTYSTVARFNPVSQNVEALTFSEGEPASIPSVVSISGRSSLITCGKGAKDLIGRPKTRIFEAFKMLLTQADPDMLKSRGYDAVYSPRTITKCFLESILKNTLRRFDETEFEDLVICVPEIWRNKLNTQDGRVILRDVLHEISESGIPIVNVLSLIHI